MAKFVYAIAYRCNIGGISHHIHRYNELTNESLIQLQSKGAKIIDIRLQINNDPPPASLMVTVSSLIIYEAETPVEVKVE